MRTYEELELENEQLRRQIVEISDKNSRLSEAVDAVTHMGIYPKSFNGVPRNEWKDGWNAHGSEALKVIINHLQRDDWADTYQDKIHELHGDAESLAMQLHDARVEIEKLKALVGNQ